MRASPRQQQGQTVIGVAIAAALFAGLLAVWFTVQQRQQVDNLANSEGASLAQFAVGLRGFVAAVQGGSQTMPSNPYTVAGVNWLKPPTCGGLATNPAAGYVPCSFTALPLGPSFSTTTTLTPATLLIDARTNFIVPVYGGASQGASEAIMAAKIVSATLSQQSLPANGTFLTAYANTPVTATAPVTASAIAAADRGRVLLIADNAPSNDVFLRVDGTNKMLADLNMGGNSLQNAKDGSFAGSVRVQGTEEVDNGLSVTAGTADLRGGVITPDTEVTSVGHMTSQALYDMQVLTGASSYTVTKPDCTQANLGTSAPAIYVAMQGTGTPESLGGDALYEAHANVIDNGTTWTVSPALHATTFSLTGSSSGGNLTLNLNKAVTAANPTDQVLLVMTKCK
ncbi:MAG: hypothetical protein ACREPQ_14685 [Rhodanobacter sp.]